MPVNPPSLSQFLSALRAEIEAFGGSSASLTVRFTVRVGDGGAIAFCPVTDGESVAAAEAVHSLTLEVGVAHAGSVVSVSGPAKDYKRSPVEPATELQLAADSGTLGRRLEFVLGGPPGFNTGAKAEILADLLGEFGTGRVIEALHREWATEFDTGPDASPSVVKVPGTLRRQTRR